MVMLKILECLSQLFQAPALIGAMSSLDSQGYRAQLAIPSLCSCRTKMFAPRSCSTLMAGLEHLDHELLDQARVFCISLKYPLSSALHAGGTPDEIYRCEEGGGSCSFGISPEP